MRTAAAMWAPTKRTTTTATDLYNCQMTDVSPDNLTADPANSRHAPAPDVLDALRDATASRHAELDQAMPLAHAAPTLQHYQEHLALLRSWLAPIEAWESGYADGPQDPALLPPAPHLPQIEADLAHPTLPAAAPLPAAAWSGRDDAAYRWGVAYVIEGSRLGGTVLHRRHAERLAPHPLRYLQADGVPPGPRWQHFIRTLRAQVRDSDAIAAACAGACAAFDSLIVMRRATPGTA